MPVLDPQLLEARTQEIGRDLFHRAKRSHEHLTTLNRWTRQVLGWCLSDRQVKTRVLGLIDVLPSLRTPGRVVRHLREYFPPELRLPAALRLGVSLARPGLLTAAPVRVVVRQLVEQVARQFIAADASPEEATAIVSRLAGERLFASFDILGEQVTSEREAEAYAGRYAALLEGLGRLHARAPEAGQPRSRPLGHVSIKPSALTARYDALCVEESLDRALRRLLPLARLAAESGFEITLDMEQYELRDLTLELAKRLLAQSVHGPGLRLGVVIQAYLRDAEPALEGLLDWLSRSGQRLSVRLVKGAYWDHEVATARQRNWAAPVYLHKWETDAAFERLAQRLLSAQALVDTQIASHNVRSIAHAMAVADTLALRKEQLEFQLLYGMGDAIRSALVELGYPVRVYAPLGALIPGMGYLVRRLLENTANESFLRQDEWEHAVADELLGPPSPPAVSIGVAGAEPAEAEEPFGDFSRRGQREAFAAALETVSGRLGARLPLLIAGEAVETGRWTASVNPAHPDQVVGLAAEAGEAEVDAAVAAAERAQPRWAIVPAADRAALLRRAAALLRERRVWFAALEVLEVGKPWREADLDVVEAIDYLEYYARRMPRLPDELRLAQRPGESNRYRLQPRGVAVVIAPWNFPLAILTGMASASLVAGNATILKPAEQSSVIAYHFARLLHEAGIPHDVAQYLPGPGERLGAALVRHPAVRLILFTGSRAVGLSIVQAAGEVPRGQRFVKHVVAEMGGKNAIIVDEDADLDAAVRGVIRSAFGYQGQKCSAASRLIAHEAVHDRLLERLAAAIDDLVVGDPVSPACDLGPLIDAKALARITRAVEQGSRRARLVYRSPAGRLPDTGYFVGPALFAEVERGDALAQEELFGPVLCAFRARGFDEALELANDVDYGLTGGVYSRSPAHVQRAIERFDVGNLYINRPITGALVGRQPFGGWKLSGLGTKAGGPDYLLQLVLPKTICENTIRHGALLE